MSDPSRQKLIRAVRLLPGVKFNKGEFEAVPQEESKATDVASQEAQHVQGPPQPNNELVAANAEIRKLKSELRSKEEDLAASVSEVKKLRGECEAMTASIVAEKDRLAKESAAAAGAVREAAAQEGKEAGFALGYKEGTASAEAEQIANYKEKFSSLVGLMESVNSSLAAAREDLALSISPQLIRLWEMMLRRLLYAEVALDEDTVKRTLADILTRVSDREKIIVYLNPEDIDLVEETRGEMKDALRGIKHFEFMADEHVDRGSCLVETNMGIYDARWRTQLEQISIEVQGLLSEGAVTDDADA